MIVPNIEACFEGYSDKKECRQKVFRYVFGVTSFNELTRQQVCAFREYISMYETELGNWLPSDQTIMFFRNLLRGAETELAMMKLL